MSRDQNARTRTILQKVLIKFEWKFPSLKFGETF